jgi:hypothetical protein
VKLAKTGLASGVKLIRRKTHASDSGFYKRAARVSQFADRLNKKLQNKGAIARPMGRWIGLYRSFDSRAALGRLKFPVLRTT